MTHTDAEPPPKNPPARTHLDGARAEAVADGERNVVLGANVEDLVPVLVGEVLLVVRQAELGVDGAAAGDNACVVFGFCFDLLVDWGEGE